MTISGQTASHIYAQPGNYQISCVVTYGMIPGSPAQPPGPRTFTRNVTIGEPTVSYLSGLGTSTEYNDGFDTPTPSSLGNSKGFYLIMRVKCSDGSDPGPYLACYPQEQIRNIILSGQAQNDEPWGPDDNNDVQYKMHRDPTSGMTVIYDWKWARHLPRPAANSIFATLTQDFRISWKDWAGVEHSGPVYSRDWKYEAIDNFHWRLLDNP